MKRLLTLPLLACSLSVAASAAAQIQSFRPVATFSVPGGTAAEIVAATPDGSQVVFTDAIGDRIWFVSLASATNPLLIGSLSVAGEPTSVDITEDGRFAIVCVKTPGAGTLLSVRLATRQVVGSLPLTGEPDSVAVTTIGGRTVAVVAIENESTPAIPGNVAVVSFDPAAPAGGTTAYVFANPATDLVGRGLLFETDPEPEYVAIHKASRRAAVTLQENNGMVVIDIANPATPAVVSIVPTGYVADRPADLMANSDVSFTDLYPSGAPVAATTGARTPDAVGWTSDGTTLFTADEGEGNFSGGRGFSWRSASGGASTDDGGSLEKLAVQFGYYPDARSNRKGIEAEALAIAPFGTSEFLFVGSERGSFVAVYRLVNGSPTFVQLLPTGIGPEGIRPIPSRGLLVVSNEGDGNSGSLSIFAGVSEVFTGTPTQPTLQSAGFTVPWGALSGLAGHPTNPNIVYGVFDRAFPATIAQITVNGRQAMVTPLARVNASGIDLEGIDLDTSILAQAGQLSFWLASEGTGMQNLILRVLADGTVTHTIPLPAEIGARVTSNGYEGIAVSGDGRKILVAIQREITGDTATTNGRLHTRIGVYHLDTQAWEFFLYPLQPAPPARPDLGAAAPWVALSEITRVGQTPLGSDIYAVIERDNRLAGLIQTKLLCYFSLDNLVSFGTGVVGAGTSNATLEAGRHVIRKSCYDIAAPFAPHEKIEGVAITPTGSLWVVRDNDGAGQSSFIRFTLPVPAVLR